MVETRLNNLEKGYANLYELIEKKDAETKEQLNLIQDSLSKLHDAVTILIEQDKE